MVGVIADSGEDRSVGYLFIAGCPRSGTTAMADLLNNDERIIIGRERFKFVKQSIEPFHFTEEVFFNPIPHETNILGPELYPEMRRKWRENEIALIGDKVPLYTYVFDRIAHRFEGCKIIFMYRDLLRVASSFIGRTQDPKDGWSSDHRDALARWNESLSRLRTFVDGEQDTNVFVVDYERFYAGGNDYFELLYEFLELEPSSSARELFSAMTAQWPERSRKPLLLDDEMKAELEAGKDNELEAWCRGLIDAALERRSELSPRR